MADATYDGPYLPADRWGEIYYVGGKELFIPIYEYVRVGALTPEAKRNFIEERVKMLLNG